MTQKKNFQKAKRYCSAACRFAFLADYD